MSRVFEAVVHGGKIALPDDAALAEGQRVQVVIDPHPVADEPAESAPRLDEGAIHTPIEDPALIELLGRIRRDRTPLPPGPTGPGRRSAAGRLADDPSWDEHLREALDSRRSATGRELPG